MKLFGKRGVPEMGGRVAPAGEDVTPASAQSFGKGFIPEWFKRMGLASWYLIGIVIVLTGLAYALHALATLVVPALFAVLLGATFMPAVDWLERHHVGRAWGALIMTVLIVAGGFALLALMTVGIVRQWPTIEQQIEAAVGWINDSLQSLDIDPSLIDSAKKTLTGSVGSWAQGVFGGALKGVSTLATFAFGAFIGLNILVYVLVGGRRIGRWASEHMGPVPPPVGYSILANSARFLRGYIWGSTLIGLFNGAVVGAGALVIGVPLAFTIFVVQWLTNYVPMFGAFIGGAFAVLIALGTGGVRDAVWMLVFVLIANGPLQTVVSQFALGASLKLSGLVVLFATTGGAILAGALVIGVPLAFTIFVVQWLTNYIPMFGAFIGGAFAVLIALGTGGVRDAVWMLIFVLIANGPLQTVVSQFALGASLKLSGLVVLFATTGGAILAGALGGIFAAPFVKIGVDAHRQLKDAGLFDDRPAEEVDGGAGPPAPDVSGPADALGPPAPSGPPGAATPGADA